MAMSILPRAWLRSRPGRGVRLTADGLELPGWFGRRTVAVADVIIDGIGLEVVTPGGKTVRLPWLRRRDVPRLYRRLLRLAAGGMVRRSNI